jgi:hypothetical protein
VPAGRHDADIRADMRSYLAAKTSSRTAAGWPSPGAFGGGTEVSLMALIEPDICDHVRLLDPSRARSARPPSPQIVQFAAVLARQREGRDPNATQTVLSARLFRSAGRPALASDMVICGVFWTPFAMLRREADSGCPVIAGVSQRCAELARTYDAPVCPSWRTPVPR